ncbi:MAG: hypothetical protein M3Q58_16110 [Bacteroidota bacterium]|nr:hypothetical protein [Bacteroidota bacterium]
MGIFETDKTKNREIGIFFESHFIYSHPAWPYHPLPSRKKGRIMIPKRIAHQPYLPSRTGPCEKTSLIPQDNWIKSLFINEIMDQKPKHPPEREEPPQKPQPNVPDKPDKPMPPDFPKPDRPHKPSPPERPDKPFQPNRPDQPTPPNHPSKPDQPSQPIA